MLWFLSLLPGIAIGTVVVAAGLCHLGYGISRFMHRIAEAGPTILTTLGIFFTFLGVTIGLSDFDSSHVEASVPKLLEGLKTAFLGSLFGVGAALSIKIREVISSRLSGPEQSSTQDVTGADLAVLLRNIQTALNGGEDSSLVSQMKLARQDTNDRLDALKKAQIEALNELSKMGSAALVEALRDVIRDFNQKLTEQFGENFRQLNDAVGRLVTWQVQYQAQLELTAQKFQAAADLMAKATADYQIVVDRSSEFGATAKELGRLLTLFDAQQHRLEEVSKALAELLRSASGSLPEIEQRIVALTSHLSDAVLANMRQLTATIEASSRQTGQVLADHSAEIKSTLQQSSTSMKQAAADQSTAMTALSKQLTDTIEAGSRETGRALEAHSAALKSVLQDSDAAMKRAMTEHSTSLKTMLQASGEETAKVQRDFSTKINEMVENTKEQVKILDRALAEELEKSLNSLGKQLTALSGRFVEDYRPLTDELRRVVEIAKRLP